MMSVSRAQSLETVRFETSLYLQGRAGGDLRFNGGRDP